MSRRSWAAPVAFLALLGAAQAVVAEGVAPTSTGLPPVDDDVRVGLPDLLAVLGRSDTVAPESRSAAAASLAVPAEAFAPPSAEAVAFGAVVAAALAALAWAWPVLKHVAVARFYAHVQPSEVFDNAVRERIFAHVKADPGVSATDLAKRAGVSWGTTIYHLEVLEQTRMVVSLRNGRYRRYFENGAGDAAKRTAVAVLRNDVTAKVAKALSAHPGLSQKEAARLVGLSPQALHWHINRLAGAGLLRRERDGRVVRHFMAEKTEA
ncbi:MAG TPA: winged helix-turn-helix transcriptional regulator [Candidatus Thermoplasmatota archaeon]|nr:winged helix-turn-helix transcriptional regulator [Candidatus Thermoplasmatota archaeon]